MSSEQKTTKKGWRVSRRGFLIGLGVTGAGLALGVPIALPMVRLQIGETFGDPNSLGQGSTVDVGPLTWFEITPANVMTLHVPKVEMGQGIHTALAQIVAEELAVDWEQLQVQTASTARGFGSSVSTTSGSSSVVSLYQPLREAAATMREMLRAEAARQLAVPLNELVAERGVIKGQNKQLSYGEIVARATTWEVPEQAPTLKAATDFEVIGQPLPRVDLPAKIVGEAIYGYDMRLPGMLYGAVARSLTVGGRLKAARPGTAASLPGVIKVVIADGFAGVVAESRAQAYAGVNALELEWEPGPALEQAELDRLVTVSDNAGVVIQKDGDALDQLAAGPVVRAEYRTPLAAHAHLEPQAALADVQADRVRVWFSTQAQESARTAVAEALGRSAETVEVTATYIGGGFGRRVDPAAAVEAARLSAAVGRPVHVGWNRVEEFRNGYFRPPTHHVLQARLDGEQIAAIWHQQASGDVAFGFIPDALAFVAGADPGAWRGGQIHYNIPHRRTSAQRVKLPIPTGFWRGLGLLANTFAIESFMDELAHSLGRDPLAFRLDHLPEGEFGERYRRVIEAATSAAGWASPAPAGRARGLACSSDVSTIVAQVAEVSIENGAIRVHKITAAMDAGLVINPDGATAQTQGSIMMGLSSTFLEALTIKEGRIEAANFDRYPLLTIKDAPEVEVVLVPGGTQPRGIGEPPLGPVAAAVANAVFRLTGQRLRELPLKLA